MSCCFLLQFVCDTQRQRGVLLNSCLKRKDAKIWDAKWNYSSTEVHHQNKLGIITMTIQVHLHVHVPGCYCNVCGITQA